MSPLILKEKPSRIYMILCVGECYVAGGGTLTEDGETIPLSKLIAALETERIRLRKMMLNKSGSQTVLIGLESLLTSIQRLEGEAGLKAWFESQHNPEGLNFYQVKNLIDKHNLKEEVMKCFWNGDEETRPQKGKPLSLLRCRQQDMAAHIYSRFIAANRVRLPLHRQIPISFAMQLYAEFVLHKRVNYRSVRPGVHNINAWKFVGSAQTLIARSLDCRDAPAEQPPNNKTSGIPSKYLLQESTRLIHSPCIQAESTRSIHTPCSEVGSRSEEYSTSSLSSTLYMEPCVKESTKLIHTPCIEAESRSEKYSTTAESSAMPIEPCVKESTRLIHNPCIKAESSLEKYSTSSPLPTKPCAKESSRLLCTPTSLSSEAKTASLKDTRSLASSLVDIAPCIKESSRSMYESSAVQLSTSEAKAKASRCSSSSQIPKVPCVKESSEVVHMPSTVPDVTSQVKVGSVIKSTSLLCSAGHIAPSVRVEDSKTRVAKSWKHLEGAIKQGLYDCNLQFEEVHQKLEERELQLNEAKQQNRELAKKLHGFEETRQKLEETMHQLQETRLQLEEQEKLINTLRWQAEAHEREVKEANYHQQVYERELLEELTSTRIALHNVKQVLAYLSPPIFERNTGIALQIVPPSDVFLLDSACTFEQCGICHTDLNCIGWFTLGCNHSFHLHCITQSLARVASCEVCKVVVPEALYKSLGMDDLHPAKYGGHNN